MPEDLPDVEEKEEEKLEPEVTIEKEGPCKQRLNITVSADKVTAEIDKAYKELLEAVDVPGFRKGRVPRSLAEKRFGKQINEETGKKISTDAFLEVVKDKEMDTIGQPHFGEVKLEPGRPLTFDVTVYIKPSVELDEYKGMPLGKKATGVTDKEIDEHIENLRRSKAPLGPVERGAEKGDQVILDFAITSDDRELRSIEDARLFVEGDQFFGMQVEDLEKAFSGRKAGDEFEIDVTLPDDFREEEYRGRPAKISIKMKEVKAPQLPEVNDEWAQSLDFDDVEDMRDEFETILKRKKIAEADSDLRRQVRERLLEKADFELPEDLIEQQAESVFTRRRMELESLGVPPEEIDGRIEELRSTQQEATRKSFKLFFILQHIAEKEKIFVTEDEVDARIAAMASRRRNTSPEELRTLYEQDNVMNELRVEMREEKTIQFIIDNAEITEESEQEAEEEQGETGDR
ncbi:MAG: trigger factor [Planctomycetota bacterium]|nr:MAG: trigger factor [Planctomycetota bacterium]